MAVVANKPSFIEYRNLRFLIIDAPTDANLEAYIKVFKENNVTDVVRACECSYSKERLQREGVEVHDMPYPDGDPPPADIIRRWLDLCKRRFAKGNPAHHTIAVHCVAGLGRAPVLVAIALIENGLEALEAVNEIRSKRRGAINARQLHYLEYDYKRQGGGGPCCIM